MNTKFLKLLGASALAATMLVGCGANDEQEPPPEDNDGIEEPAELEDGNDINDNDHDDLNNDDDGMLEDGDNTDENLDEDIPAEEENKDNM